LDLERDSDQAFLSHPQSFLELRKGLVVLDEIQRRPDLLPLLRVLADREPAPCRFLILGSASLELIKHSSESLAGRVRFVDMSGFSIEEVGNERMRDLWQRGGFPKSFLAETLLDSVHWREDFIRTFLERDIPQLGVQIPAVTLRRFWSMTAHYHAQIWNSSELAASLSIAHTTSRRYLDLLTGAFMIRQLPPWFENAGKRVVKSPKIYIRDSGLLHALLRIDAFETLQGHPKYGASWEGFAMEQILSRAGERDAFFWGTHRGAELDLLLLKKGKRWGIEFKAGDAPRTTKSMRIAMETLDLEHLWVVHPGADRFALDETITAIPLVEALTLPIY
jgi:predicted AAA+ superfamily ATPase